jgi:hypothetical protein
VRRAYHYNFGGIFGHPYIMADSDHMVTVTTAEDTTAITVGAIVTMVEATVIMEGAMVTSILESIQIIN